MLTLRIINYSNFYGKYQIKTKVPDRIEVKS